MECGCVNNFKHPHMPLCSATPMWALQGATLVSTVAVKLVLNWQWKEA